MCMMLVNFILSKLHIIHRSFFVLVPLFLLHICDHIVRHKSDCEAKTDIKATQSYQYRVTYKFMVTVLNTKYEVQFNNWTSVSTFQPWYTINRIWIWILKKNYGHQTIKSPFEVSQALILSALYPWVSCTQTPPLGHSDPPPWIFTPKTSPRCFSLWLGATTMQLQLKYLSGQRQLYWYTAKNNVIQLQRASTWNYRGDNKNYQ